jgi:hypothetical protein
MSGRRPAAEVPENIARPDWQGLLEAAMETEGGSLKHYNALYRYSMGNLAFLMYQGVTPQPVANYQRWPEVGRHVKRGAKAFYILRPITVKLHDQLDEQGQPKTIQRFKPVKSVFRLEDTEGDPLPEIELPEWSRDRALGALGLRIVEFEAFEAGMQGYSRDKDIAINPIAKYPEKTFFHETAHHVVGHVAGDHAEYVQHRGVFEAEAEGTAHLVMNELDLLTDDARSSSGAYLRHWLGGQPVPEKSVRRIFKGTDDILKAGREEAEEQVA